MQVLSLGYHESLTSCTNWKNTYNLTYPVLSDLSGSISITYIPYNGGLWFPHNAIVDESQILRSSVTGFSAAGMRATLNSLMSPEIATDTDTLDFGLITQGYLATRSFIIDNVGTGIVQVTNIVSSSSNYYSAPSVGNVYAYNDSLVVAVTFSPSHPGLYSETLQVISSGGNATITVMGMCEAVSMTNVTATKIGSHIGISWNPIPTADRYNIYASPDPNVEIEPVNLIGFTSNNNYLDINALSRPGVTAKYYRITAVFNY